ncbi:N-6 DNA methylase [Nocardia sp. CA-119907]|uniref:class I SAM-dependent DNA methyltransferase n=1 Tax=Nocardia sp. CA-119907 TaxID=3239973 RepID=UPI003D953C7B
MSEVTVAADGDHIIVAGLNPDTPAHAALAAHPDWTLSADGRTWTLSNTPASRLGRTSVDDVRALLTGFGCTIAEGPRPGVAPADSAKPSVAVLNHSAFLWGLSDLLRGDYKQSEYLMVVLPLTMVRRLDFLLEPTKRAVLDTYAIHGDRPDLLAAAAETQGLYNICSLSSLTDVLAAADPAAALRTYLAGFCVSARELLGHFDFDTHITRLDQAGLVRAVLGAFTDPRLDLHPDRFSNIEMGLLYEELLRRFCEISHDTAGEHFTPIEVVTLMVDLLLADPPAHPNRIRVLDPAAGTGGMLAETHHRLRQHYPDADLILCGQELNAQTYSIAAAEQLMSGRSGQLALGNSLTADAFTDQRFDLLIANPPFGVDWRRIAEPIRAEHTRDGFDGRFGAGIPRTTDGTLLFLQHMIAKMRPAADGGSRIAVLTSGSALFNGAAGSGESEIRRWIIDNDWLDAIIALPEAMFYNTAIAPYIWILSNRKPDARQGRIAYIDARDRATKARRRLGSKKHELPTEQIAAIVADYRDFTDSATVKIMPNHAFGHLHIKIRRPMRARWEITPATRATVADHPQLRELPDEMLAAVLAKLDRTPDQVLTDQSKARIRVAELLAGTSVKGSPVHQAVLTALRVWDPDAAPMLDNMGRPVTDTDWSDTEQVPLEANLRYTPDTAMIIDTEHSERLIEQYLDHHVRPHIPGAWAEPTKTRLAYQIHTANRYFTTFHQLEYRDPDEILDEMIASEEKILAILREMKGTFGRVKATDNGC